MMTGMRGGISLLAVVLSGCATSYYGGTGSISPVFDLDRKYTLELLPLETSPYIRSSDLKILNDLLLMELMNMGIFKPVDSKGSEIQSAKGKHMKADILATYDVLTARMRDDVFGTTYMLEIVVKLVDGRTGEILYFGRGTGYGKTKGEAMENAVRGALELLREKLEK